MFVEAAARQTISPIYGDLHLLDAPRLRRLIRIGAYDGHTSRLARTRLQASLVIMPRRFAHDFQQFCVRNPKSCPLVGVSRHGSPLLPTLGDLDVRVDLPLYDILRLGEVVRRQTDITGLWREDFAAFALGGSFTFEHALLDKGVTLRPIGRDKTVAMFNTRIPQSHVGPFGSDMVVSMRPVQRRDVDKVRSVTARYPQAHGAPVHVGDPSVIGIDDITVPDWGDAVELRDGEVPVFWASAMTARAAITQAGLDMAIANTPGRMLVTDIDARSDIGNFRMFF